MRWIRAVLLLSACSAGVWAQAEENDICILKPINAGRLTGKVVAAGGLAGEFERPLAGAIVELRAVGELRVIAETTTDSNGHFMLSTVSPNNYSLAVTPPVSESSLFSTAVEVHFTKRSHKQKGEIVLALGSLFGGCHGGYAQVRNNRDK